MPGPSVLLLLASLPCSQPEATTRMLEETARERPAEVAHVVDGLEVSTNGMPLRALGREEDGPTQARAVATRLERACALQEAAAREQTPSERGEPERLRAILDRPEFANARQRNSDLLQRLLRELEAWTDRLFESRGAVGFAVATRAVILGLALAVALWAALRLRQRRPSVSRMARAPVGAQALALDSPREHLQRARAALASDAREAIREGLLSLLSALEERRLARPDRVKTNRELAAELPGRGAPESLVREVEGLMRWYDGAFYSLAPVPAADAARFVDDVERVQGAMPGVAA
ncbi:hypothetical protein P2318_14345 [Myxococcaceae bacterium GXIMD 01537]